MNDKNDRARRPFDLLSLVPLHLLTSEVDTALARAKEARTAYERAYEEERRLYSRARFIDLNAPGFTREAAASMVKWGNAHSACRGAESELYGANIHACQRMLQFALSEADAARRRLIDEQRAHADLRGRGAAGELFALCELKNAEVALKSCFNYADRTRAAQEQLEAAERQRLAEIEARDAACLAKANGMAVPKLVEARRLLRAQKLR